MASTLNALFGALVAAAFWSCIGIAIARRIMPAALAWPVAPTLGWAVHSAASFPILTLIGFSTVNAAIVAALALIASIVALARPGGSPSVSLPLWIWGGAALLAMGVAVAILPKTYGDSVILAPAIFDHSKLAMIDEMTRHGLPPGNPFFHEAGGPERLVYYYLFYYSAAGLSLLTGISGWEADVAMTWFAAFSALLLMMGLAAWFGGRPLAALWVLPLAVSASLRPLLFMLFGHPRVDAVLMSATGFAGWQSQAAWVPQHLMSATCVVLAILLLSQLAKRQSVLLVATFVLVVVAGFESSTWVGGVAFAVAALAVGIVLLIRAEPGDRLPFVAGAAIAGVLGNLPRRALPLRSVRGDRNARQRLSDRAAAVRRSGRLVSRAATPRSGPAGLLAHFPGGRISRSLSDRGRHAVQARWIDENWSRSESGRRSRSRRSVPPASRCPGCWSARSPTTISAGARCCRARWCSLSSRRLACIAGSPPGPSSRPRQRWCCSPWGCRKASDICVRISPANPLHPGRRLPRRRRCGRRCDGISRPTSGSATIRIFSAISRSGTSTSPGRCCRTAVHALPASRSYWPIPRCPTRAGKRSTGSSPRFSPAKARPMIFGNLPPATTATSS